MVLWHRGALDENIKADLLETGRWLKRIFQGLAEQLKERKKAVFKDEQ